MARSRPQPHSIIKLTISEQVAQRLRDEIQAGVWHDGLPGIRPLAERLNVARATMAKALAILEREGWLASVGSNTPRSIVAGQRMREAKAKGSDLRVALLLQRKMEEEGDLARNTISRIFRNIQSTGHECVMAHLPSNLKSSAQQRLRRLVESTHADAWVIYRGSQKVLEWFSQSTVPALAFAGRYDALPIAAVGMDASSVMHEVIRRLTDLGHRRIVTLCPLRSRQPKPALFLQAVLEALRSAGISPSEYHVPDWEESPQGCRRLLESLFRVTPPTALLCFDELYVAGVLAFCQERGLQIPRDLSLFSADPAVFFSWSSPGLDIAHMIQPIQRVESRVRRWLGEVAKGRNPRTQDFVSASLHPGNSLGPVPGTFT